VFLSGLGNLSQTLRHWVAIDDDSGVLGTIKTCEQMCNITKYGL